MMSSVLWPFSASGSIFVQRLCGQTKESRARPASSNISTALLLGRFAYTGVLYCWLQNTFKSYFIIRLTALSWKSATFLGLWESVLLRSNPGCPPDTSFFPMETLINLTIGLGDELDQFKHSPFESTVSRLFVPGRRYSVSWVLHPLVN